MQANEYCKFCQSLKINAKNVITNEPIFHPQFNTPPHRTLESQYIYQTVRPQLQRIQLLSFSSHFSFFVLVDNRYEKQQYYVIVFLLLLFFNFVLPCKRKTYILLTSSNNQISKFRIPNIYNEIFVLIFLMILRTHFEASLRFRKNQKRLRDFNI